MKNKSDFVIQVSGMRLDWIRVTGQDQNRAEELRSADEMETIFCLLNQFRSDDGRMRNE